MTKPLQFTQASLKRAIDGARKAGLRVTGIRADGTIMVDDGDNSDGTVPIVAPSPQSTPEPSSKWRD